MPHELTMRRGARGSQLVLNLSSVSWSTALAHPLEVCDGKLWCLVPCTAGQRSREWASVLGPATKFLSEFGYTCSKVSINYLDASFLEDGYVVPKGCWMSFLWCQVASAAEPVLLKGDVLLMLVSQCVRDRALVSTLCLSGSLGVHVCAHRCLGSAARLQLTLFRKEVLCYLRKVSFNL